MNTLDLDESLNRQLYYLGVISFQEKDYPVAVWYFTETTWYADDLQLINSAKGFLDLINYYHDRKLRLCSLRLEYFQYVQ